LLPPAPEARWPDPPNASRRGLGRDATLCPGDGYIRRIGTQGNQTRAFLQGVSGTSISGPTQRVLINANGQLGTAKAAAGKPGGAGAEAASADRKLRAKVNRLQRAVRQLRAEVKRAH
jgi:hypothetical protein